jgi:hypothetical protein
VNAPSDPLIIELRTGLWMVKTEGREGEPGVIRGYLSTIEVDGATRFLARLPHLNPTQGVRLGEFWEWERAVEAVLAEAPRPLVVDPFRDLHYSTAAERRERSERRERAGRRRRLAGRLSD